MVRGWIGPAPGETFFTSIFLWFADSGYKLSVIMLFHLLYFFELHIPADVKTRRDSTLRR
jgi:hypothetical protein